MKEINYDTLEIAGIDYNDVPDFSDAYFYYGEYVDGTKIEDAVLEDLSCSDIKYEFIRNKVY
jgi:hypothetical protein